MKVDEESSRLVSIDYLRGFLTILVVLHHSLLGYTSHGTASLIVDPNKFAFFDNITSLLDTFFMFLFFFISGIFTLGSIEKKGTLQYLKERVIRLAIPFLFGWLIINMPAYFISFKAYIQFSFGSAPTFGQFLRYWIETQKMATSGPLWFLWVLISFDILLSTSHYIIKKIRINRKIKEQRVFNNPGLFLVSFFIIGFILFTFFAKLNNNAFYIIWGPFMAQVNGLPLYFFFFITGAVLSPKAIAEGIFSKKSYLVKKWWINAILGLFFWRLLYFPWLYSGKLLSYIFLTAIFVLAAMFLSFSMFSFFLKYCNHKNIIFNNLQKNAYGIYIIHYSIVALIQYAFLFMNLPGLLEGSFVFLLSLLISWFFSIILRKIPLINKIIG